MLLFTHTKTITKMNTKEKFLVDGKRSSTKPIWKSEFYKPINIDVLKELINHIDIVIKQYI